MVVTDHLGTPMELIDEEGKIAWQGRLDLFGKVTEEVTETSCPIRWPGQYEDEETGLFYNRLRYYDRELGRYISQDGLRLLAGFAFYSYVRDVLVQADPLGLSSCRIYFGQRRIGPHFRKESLAPDFIRGRLLEEVAADIKAGRIDVDDIPIEYFRDPRTGLYTAINNRGLAVISMAKEKPTFTVLTKPTEAELDRLNQPPLSRFPSLPSSRIPVTRGRRDLDVLYVVSLPD
jgi:RHS repeat-associated protein